MLSDHERANYHDLSRWPTTATTTTIQLRWAQPPWLLFERNMCNPLEALLSPDPLRKGRTWPDSKPAPILCYHLASHAAGIFTPAACGTYACVDSCDRNFQATHARENAHIDFLKFLIAARTNWLPVCLIGSEPPASAHSSSSGVVGGFACSSAPGTIPPASGPLPTSVPVIRWEQRRRCAPSQSCSTIYSPLRGVYRLLGEGRHETHRCATYTYLA